MTRHRATHSSSVKTAMAHQRSSPLQRIDAVGDGGGVAVAVPVEDPPAGGIVEQGRDQELQAGFVLGQVDVLAPAGPLRCASAARRAAAPKRPAMLSV